MLRLRCHHVVHVVMEVITMFTDEFGTPEQLFSKAAECDALQSSWGPPEPEPWQTLVRDAVRDAKDRGCSNPTCTTPLSKGQKLRTCTGCFLEGYCSQQCQRSDWSAHKVVCPDPCKIPFTRYGLTPHDVREMTRGSSLLLRAANSGDVNAVCTLQRTYRMRTLVRNRLRQTTLHLAAMNGHETATYELLIGSSGDPPEFLNYRPGRGMMGRRPSPMSQDKQGNTALHLAAQSGHTMCVRIICTQLSPTGDLEVSAVNKKGLTAFELAILSDQQRVATWMWQHLPDVRNVSSHRERRVSWKQLTGVDKSSLNSSLKGKKDVPLMQFHETRLKEQGYPGDDAKTKSFTQQEKNAQQREKEADAWFDKTLKDNLELREMMNVHRSYNRLFRGR